LAPPGRSITGESKTRLIEVNPERRTDARLVADPTLLEGVSAKIVETPRLSTHMLTGGDERAEPVFFVHGNVSSSSFFEETLAALPGEGGYRGFAPDLRAEPLHRDQRDCCHCQSLRSSGGDVRPVRLVLGLTAG
jgi:pimeloyl-ACP methyl ester carboxylesterase